MSKAPMDIFWACTGVPIGVFAWGYGDTREEAVAKAAFIAAAVNSHADLLEVCNDAFQALGAALTALQFSTEAMAHYRSIVRRLEIPADGLMERIEAVISKAEGGSRDALAGRGQ